jgi:penicillin-binding protein 1A
VQPHIITRVRTADGKLLYQRKGASFGRVIEFDHVGMMNAMLQETLIIGTGKHAELPGWQAAGKTGTSQDHRDAWFVGYTSQLVTGVWLGNDDNSPTRKTSGGNLPVNIWSKYMRTALLGAAPTPLPGLAPGADPTGILPPAEIGATRPQAGRDAIGDMISPPRERNFFERLFGG